MHGIANALLRPLPIAAPELGERRSGLAGADVAAHAIGVLGGDAEPAVVGVFDVQIFALNARRSVGDPHQSAIPADPVVDVHHELADLEVAEETIARRDACAAHQT